MRNIKLPSKPFKGLKLYCRVCRGKVKGCNHTSDNLCYRLIVTVPNSGGQQVTKLLQAENYDDAVIESIDFKRQLEKLKYQMVNEKVEIRNSPNAYNLVTAILKYYQYLTGDSGYLHLKKNLSEAYIKEVIRYCKLFALVLKKTQNIETLLVKDVSKQDVSKFYQYLYSTYSPKTFNKCFNSLKGFFDFLIVIEDVGMKNPFANFTPKVISKCNIEILTRSEFESILVSIDRFDSKVKLGGRGEVKNMYYCWLKNAFKLFLLTGARREEVVELKWKDIFVSENGVKFLMFGNLKVERIKKFSNTPKKYVPINNDLESLLVEMGMNNIENPNDFILCPERKCSSRTLMDKISKSFTHYKNGAGIDKDVSLKNLRKTYITWVNQAMGNETGLLTSHSTQQVLERYYLDPKVLSAIERGALEIKVFGVNNNQEMDSNMAQKNGTK
jgi:integrase